jgi:hypothetical protein
VPPISNEAFHLPFKGGRPVRWPSYFRGNPPPRYDSRRPATAQRDGPDRTPSNLWGILKESGRPHISRQPGTPRCSCLSCLHLFWFWGRINPTLHRENSPKPANRFEPAHSRTTIPLPVDTPTAARCASIEQRRQRKVRCIFGDTF